MAHKHILNLSEHRRRLTAYLQIVVLVTAAILPLLANGRVSAATLTNRSATINDSVINSTDVEFRFDYDLIDTAATKAGIIYEFCTTPLGACTLPTGMNVQTANTHDSQNGWPSNGTAFAPVSEAANVGNCTLNTNAYMICYSRDEAVATAVTGGAVDHTISGITAPSAIQSVYIRIHVYSDDDFGAGDILDEGTVAVAFVDQLTINGRVQERLDFCVAAIDDDDTVPANVSTCSALTDSNVDIGVIDDSTIAVAPVEPTTTNGSDDDYGILMVNTNASGGVVLGYYAEDPTSVSGGDTHQLKSFRVVPTDCNATASVTTDQCFVSASNAGSGSTITQSNELFGMYIPCVDQNDGSRSTTANLTSVNAAYNGDDNTITTSAGCETETFTSGTATVAWNTGSSADTLISSTSVVDDEIVKLRFAATASSTTPTGSYTVTTTYIATGTF